MLLSGGHRRTMRAVSRNGVFVKMKMEISSGRIMPVLLYQLND